MGGGGAGGGEKGEEGRKQEEEEREKEREKERRKCPTSGSNTSPQNTTKHLTTKHHKHHTKHKHHKMPNIRIELIFFACGGLDSRCNSYFIRFDSGKFGNRASEHHREIIATTR